MARGNLLAKVECRMGLCIRKKKSAKYETEGGREKHRKNRHLLIFIKCLLYIRYIETPKDREKYRETEKKGADYNERDGEKYRETGMHGQVRI